MTWLKASETRADERPSSDTDKPVKPVRCAVPREYLPLHRYLENRYADAVVLTFSQMADLLGFALPDQARQEQWWANTPATDAHSCFWTQAGRVATPNLAARTVLFERAFA